MTKNTRFSPEVRQRAIRMVLESQDEYDSQWAAICSIAPKIGCTPETLRVWVRQHERDTGGGSTRVNLLSHRPCGDRLLLHPSSDKPRP